jgi:hypothetical protein
MSPSYFWNHKSTQRPWQVSLFLVCLFTSSWKFWPHPLDVLMKWAHKDTHTHNSGGILFSVLSPVMGIIWKSATFGAEKNKNVFMNTFCLPWRLILTSFHVCLKASHARTHVSVNNPFLTEFCRLSNRLRVILCLCGCLFHGFTSLRIGAALEYSKVWLITPNSKMKFFQTPPLSAIPQVIQTSVEIQGIK